MKRDIGPGSLRAAFSPDSLDEERRTVELVWTTGARVMRGVFDRYWEELSLKRDHVRMDRLRSGTAPLLDSHNGADLSGVLGVVESARLEKDLGTARVRFARAEDDPHADQIFRKIKDGVIRGVSVGYRVYRLEKVEQTEGEIPVYRATDWEPYELSMVPMGADAAAGVRSDRDRTNPCEVVDGEPEEEMTVELRQEESGSSDVLELERERVVGLWRANRALGLPVEFVETYVTAGTSVDEFRALGIAERAKKAVTFEPPPQPSVEVGEDARDKWIRGATSWLLHRGAVADMVTAAAQKRGRENPASDPGEFRGQSLLDLARQALERQGVRTAGLSRMNLVGLAMTRAVGQQTTSDFAVLLENVLHKTLLSAYALTPDTWTLFCATGSVSDFRAHTRYRLGSFGQLTTVNQSGEFHNQAIPDGEKQSITATTKGTIIALSRQAIVNDDLGAFTQLSSQLGRAARMTVEKDVYALLALNSGLGPAMSDGQTLFYSAHGNVGAGAALGVAALDANRVLMASQMDPSSQDYLDLRPEILLVPIGLGGAARVINNAEYDSDAVDSPTDKKNKYMVPNKVRGLFRTIVDSPRLTGTRRYLFASPAIAPTIEVAFLEGQEEPYLESQDGWRIDGVEWKVRLDYGVAAIDFRGAVTDAGG